MKKNVHSIIQLKERRAELRRNLTPSEAFLWKNIKARKFKGKRFTKQHSIGKYIVDFYCAEARLIIELDGEIHNNSTAEEYDSKRDSLLEEMGFTILRFENKMVFENLSSVLKELENHFDKTPRTA